MKHVFTVAILCLSLVSCGHNLPQARQKYFQTNCNYDAIGGTEFVFATVPPGKQADAYKSWRSEPGVPFPDAKPLKYQEYVGRKGKLTGKLLLNLSKWGEIAEPDYVRSMGMMIAGHTHWEALMENCESVLLIEREYVKSTYPDFIYRGQSRIPRGTYLIKDVEHAKSFVGKTLWLNKTAGPDPSDSWNASLGLVPKLTLLTHQAPSRLKTDNPSISYPIHHLEPLLVTDVALDHYDLHGGAFAIKVKNKDGNEGFIEFNTRFFLESDPVPFGTPGDIRQVIERETVKLGMTKAQVVVSWGKPKKINKSVGANGVQEQWVYSDQYLYFDGDVLKSLQSSE